MNETQSLKFVLIINYDFLFSSIEIFVRLYDSESKLFDPGFHQNSAPSGIFILILEKRIIRITSNF